MALSRRFAVEAEPTGLGTPEAWVSCRVLEHGPGRDNKIACALPWNRTGPMTSEGHGPERRLRPASAAALRSPIAAGVPGAAYRIGQTILGAPGHIEAAWTRCVVRDRMASMTVGNERAPDSQRLDCVSAHLDHDGRKIQTVSEVRVKASWMKPDQHGFRPEWQLANARGQDAAHRAGAAQTAAALAAPAQRPAAHGAATAVRAGRCECRANGSARMNMNFTVTGPGSYRNDSGNGRLSLGPGGRLTLTGPMLESMPGGFVAVCHDPGGRPTVSFRSPRGAEAAFCEVPG